MQCSAVLVHHAMHCGSGCLARVGRVGERALAHRAEGLPVAVEELNLPPARVRPPKAGRARRHRRRAVARTGALLVVDLPEDRSVPTCTCTCTCEYTCYMHMRMCMCGPGSPKGHASDSASWAGARARMARRGARRTRGRSRHCRHRSHGSSPPRRKATGSRPALPHAQFPQPPPHAAQSPA